ncbi:MAG: SGNH/GDSL hydrolase family protein [Bacteroides sp.]|jgi:lysophospholipase L1-like esterase|nr:SGNH/GDSL hydrolase family protein [Bacteroides sp.]
MNKKLLIFLTLLIFLVWSCESSELNPGDLAPMTYSYLALGDSYTIGQGVEEQDRYPDQLRDTLGKAGLPIDEMLIIARTGWTTDELSIGIDNATVHPPYDLVTLLIGVNNQYRGRSLENYREEFSVLLIRAIGFAGGDPEKVVVLSIPDWGVTPFAQGRDREKIAREIDAFNAIKLDESQKAGVSYIDVTEISRLALDRPELLAPDGLHPSEIMYSLWVEELSPLAFQILKNH